MKNNIALLLPYFGKLPPYFGFYLKSLEGKHLDVLFFSDLEIGSHPDNFKVIRMTFDELRELAHNRLGTGIGLTTPKKLCDFKPMYGRIFEEWLNGYDFWMFGDCDLVFGRAFNDLLDSLASGGWDVMSVRKPWVSGPCCLLRNSETVRTLFTRARNWKEVAGESGANNLWDECGACFHPRLESGEMTMADCERIRDSFGAVVWRSSDIRFFHEDHITECGLKGRMVEMRGDGSLWLDGEEIAVFHFIGVKTRRYFKWAEVPYERASGFVIDDAGFYVTERERSWRWWINRWRKLRAVFASLRKNGFKRIAVTLGLRKNCK